MVLDPEHYAVASAYELLQAAASGLIGIDHRFLHALLDDPARSLPDLVRFASEDRSRDPVSVDEDLVAIFRYLRTPQATPFFIEIIRREPFELPDGVAEGLVEVGPATVEPLLELCAALDEEEAGEAAFCLALLGERDPRVLKLLLDRLEYDAADGALSLGVYGDPAAIPALERTLAEAPSGNDRLRSNLAEAIRDLQQGRPPVTHEPFDIWSLYPEMSSPAFDALNEQQRLEVLSADSPEYRADAAASFFNQEYSTAVLAKLLEVARGDADPNVRGRAWEALLDHAKEKDIRESMLAVLADPASPLAEQGGALVALSQHTDLEAVRSAIEQLYQQPTSRAKALEAMWRALDPTFAPYFPRHLDDIDPEVQRQAIWGVGYCGLHAEAARLRKFFDNDELRSDALFAYALVAPTEVTRGRMRPLLRKIEDAAGGLSEEEGDLVKLALDQRLEIHGLAPVFFVDEEAEPAPPPKSPVGRNDPCPCGSGKKYKKCCGA